MLVRELIERASTLLGDISPQFVTWSERELVGYLNDAARAVVRWVPAAGARTDAFRLSPGAKQSIADIPGVRLIPGDGTAAAAHTQGVVLFDVTQNLGTDGRQPGDVVTVTEKKSLDSSSPGWHRDIATQVEHYLFDPRLPTEFYVWPAPANASQWVEIRYQALPQTVQVVSPGQFGKDGTDSTTLPLPDLYADDMLNYLMARACLKDTATSVLLSAAQGYTQMFVSSINAQAQAQTGANPNLTMLPFSPTPSGQAK